MQWLIDIIIEKIGIPPVYIDRGDPANEDFDKTDLTLDNVWHELDLSAIIPENAKAVVINANIGATTTAKNFMLRGLGNTNIHNVSNLRTQVAAIGIYTDMIVALDVDRKIEYKVSVATWIILNLTIKGWWL